MNKTEFTKSRRGSGIQESVVRINTNGSKTLSAARRKIPACIFPVLYSVFWLLIPVFFIFISGCGSAPPQLSDTHLKAAELNRKAEAAFRKADYKQALFLYSEALRTDRSIEDLDGIAINLINLAAVSRETGDRVKAHKYINEIFNSSPMTQNTSLLAEAAFVKASVCVDEGGYALSAEWADKALSFCRDKECGPEGKLYNLKARLSLLKGDPASALSYGSAALELNSKHKDSEETANSLRLLASAKASKGDMGGAEKLYEEALAIDKAAGLSRKVIIDLAGLGDILAAQGRNEGALQHYQRALSAAGNAGAEQAVKDLSEKISVLNKKQTK